MKFLYFILLVVPVVFYSCQSDSPVAPPPQDDYFKLYTFEQSNVRLELYSATANTLRTGYNDLGFKVFINNTQKTDGFFKFIPKMYHTIVFNWHSSPTSPSFTYDQSKSMFMGYASFLMVSDSGSQWYGFFNYNDEASIDSVMFNVQASGLSQVKYFVDVNAGDSYYITLVSPFYPKQGPNVLRCILHKSQNDISFTQIDNAQMFIRTWMETMGHGSSNNVHPAYIGGGIYEGSANFNMSGIWAVYDSIKIGNNFITPVTPPKFTFDVP